MFRLKQKHCTGALLEPLDDEYDYVRIACLNAIAPLARASPTFAAICLDSTVDMLHDPMPAVRAAAAHTLCEVIVHVAHTEALVKWIRPGLSDGSAAVRLVTAE